jgi:hypothetical protein
MPSKPQQYNFFGQLFFTVALEDLSLGNLEIAAL